MSAESLLPWYGKDTLTCPVASADNRCDMVIIAGEDPYAFKGPGFKPKFAFVRGRGDKSKPK